MTDSDALRAQRYRAHQRGDHRLCDEKRCADAGSALGNPVETSVVDAVHVVVNSLNLAPADSCTPLAHLALALAERFDRGEPVAAQLRPVLADLQRVVHMAQAGLR